ncbi:hypothetical protein SAMN05216188_11853 [Lentzea xinjiangensis]|uniref:Uncharacterized protein n=1 Tax=Lentzea xinjiangensis TaxID=402600 RepID=A0A1H9TF55_9PSEU|nr:hypothetical protein [Lentzea xinjiangensis]SER95243.1 hypothetical protein SAMN05216188_11853 [Lentzea xinjiangensis]
MPDIWLPGWNRHPFGLRGKTYQYGHNPKGCLHTTEGTSIAGALAAYAPYPPHGIYDWRTRQKLQHVPLNLASYSAMDGNDDDYMVQIELVGFAAESRFWPDEAWRNIAEDVIKPIEDHFGVPRRALDFKDGRDGITPYISSAQSPIRISPTQLRDFSGWLGHQHLCAPDTHWDPGAIQINKIFSYLEDDVSAEEVWNYPLVMVHADGTTHTANAREVLRHSELQHEVTRSELSKVKSDLSKLQAQVAELKASGIPTVAKVDVTEIAKAVNDEGDRRDRDGDPKTGTPS